MRETGHVKIWENKSSWQRENQVQCPEVGMSLARGMHRSVQKGSYRQAV